MVRLASLPLLAAACGAAYTPPLAFDGAEPSRLTEVAYSFNCADTKTKIRYRQERKPLEEVGRLDQALAVSLLELSWSKVPVRAEDIGPVDAMVRNFGWIERVEAQCYAGDVQLSIRGMPLAPWIAYVEDRTTSRPDLETRTVTVRSDGSVRGSGP